MEQDTRKVYVGERFTAARVGREVSVAGNCYSHWSLQVQGDHVPTSFTVVLQGSLDGLNWTTLISHATAAGGVLLPADATPRPVRWIRLNCTAVVLGASATYIEAHAVGTLA